MLNNNFIGAPTVGSTDANPTLESLQAQIRLMEQQLATARASAADNPDTADDDQPQKKGKVSKFFKRFRKFFTAVIKPVLSFITKLMNALANLRKAEASLKDATTRSKKLKESFA